MLVVEEIVTKHIGVKTLASSVTQTSGGLQWKPTPHTFYPMIKEGSLLPTQAEHVFSFDQERSCEVEIYQCMTKCAATPSAPVHGTACGPACASLVPLCPCALVC